MEVNKIVAGCCATLLVFLALNFFAELIYHPHEEEELAFAMAVQESEGEAEEAPQIDLAAVFSEADPSSGEGVFRKCAACHNLEEGANAVGPSLYGVVGREVAAIGGFNYSGALPADEKWTPEHLFHFLENPQEYAPGTAMGFAGLSDPADRADVIAYLNEDDGSPMDLVAAVDTGDAAGSEGGGEGGEGEASGDAAESGESSGAGSSDGAASSDSDESDGASSGSGQSETGQAASDEGGQASEGEASSDEGGAGGGELAKAFAAADPAAGEKVFRKCSVCHKLEEGQHGVGPSLYGVVDREVASLGDYNYSEALPADKTWTPENMFHYLKDPSDWAPGTKMTFRGLDDPQDRANVIAYINEADGSPEALPGQ